LLTRIAGVLSIVIAALTIVTPIFHRLRGQKKRDAEIDRLKARIEELEKQKAEISAV
jgi:hypothetical protein